VDFLLALIELLSLGVTAEALRAIIGSKLVISLQWGQLTQNFRYNGLPPTKHSSSQKTKWTFVWKSGQMFLPSCHNPHMWQTDEQTAFSMLYHVCITCSMV